MSCNYILRCIAQLYIPHRPPFIDSLHSIYCMFLKMKLVVPRGKPLPPRPPRRLASVSASSARRPRPLRQISNGTSVSRHQLFTDAYRPDALSLTRPGGFHGHTQMQSHSVHATPPYNARNLRVKIPHTPKFTDIFIHESKNEGRNDNDETKEQDITLAHPDKIDNAS